MQLPVEALAFLDAIAIGENYNPVDYNELCGGTHFAGYDAFPTWLGIIVNGVRSHAAGRYQFEPATWQQQARIVGALDFSPLSQDVCAWNLARSVYLHRTSRDLHLDLAALNLEHVVGALKSTWSSISSSILDRYQGAITARRMLMVRPEQLHPLGATP